LPSHVVENWAAFRVQPLVPTYLKLFPVVRCPPPPPRSTPLSFTPWDQRDLRFGQFLFVPMSFWDCFFLTPYGYAPFFSRFFLGPSSKEFLNHAYLGCTVTLFPPTRPFYPRASRVYSTHRLTGVGFCNPRSLLPPVSVYSRTPSDAFYAPSSQERSSFHSSCPPECLNALSSFVQRGFG